MCRSILFVFPLLFLFCGFSYAQTYEEACAIRERNLRYAEIIISNPLKYSSLYGMATSMKSTYNQPTHTPPGASLIALRGSNAYYSQIIDHRIGNELPYLLRPTMTPLDWGSASNAIMLLLFSVFMSAIGVGLSIWCIVLFYRLFRKVGS